MATEYFKCPQCAKRYSIKRIIGNNYACPNPDCELNVRLVVHGDVANNGEVNKLYGWLLEPGTVLNRKYRIVKLLGKGGFGATYLAEDESMFNQLRAVKETPRAWCDDKEDEFLTFLSHPAIPKLYERFNYKKFHYSVMEFIEGESLEDLIKRESFGLAETTIINYAGQIADVLDYIHSKQIVHRDLKPENILIRKDGTLALIDFGISKQFISGQGTRHLARAASYAFSSPEQYQGGKGHTDFKSDIYSFGAILYFLASGNEPNDALSRDPKKDITPTPRGLNPKISKRLENAILKAMKMNKGNRFKSIRAMKATITGNGHTTAKVICPKCKNLIDKGNRFCQHCGSSTRPVVKDTTRKIVFDSGKSAGTIAELVKLCYDEWTEAKKYLYNGDFEKRLKNLPDGSRFATIAKKIRRKQRSQDAGVDQFLKNTPYYRPPVLSVSKSKINLQQLPTGYTKNLVLTISNSGSGLLAGKIKATANWIEVKQKSFSCLAGRTARLSLAINTQQLTAIRNYRAQLTIESNAGSQKIPISFRLKKAAIAKSTGPKMIQFDVNPGKTYIKHINIASAQVSKKTKAQLTSLSQWLKVKPGEIKKRNQRIKIAITTKDLSPGKHTGEILVSNGNFSKYIKILVNVTKSSALSRVNYLLPLLAFIIYAGLIGTNFTAYQLPFPKPLILISGSILIGLSFFSFGKSGISIGTIAAILFSFFFHPLSQNIAGLFSDTILNNVPGIDLHNMQLLNHDFSWFLTGVFIAILSLSVIYLLKKIRS